MKNKKPQYVLIQDTEAIFSKIDNNSKPNPAFINASSRYLSQLKLLLNEAFEEHVDVNLFTRLETEEALRDRVIKELDNKQNTVCICLDRFLLHDLENIGNYKRRFFRFHICRSLDDKKIPRPGSKPFLKQLNSLKQAIQDLNKKQFIIVDDGIFSGGTIRYFLKLLSSRNIKSTIRKIIIFVGNHKLLENFNLAPIEIINSFDNLYDWISTRDFSPFGGKILRANNGGLALTTPYIYPWSDGANASLNMSPHFFTISERMIREFKKLIKIYEGFNNNKQLTFKKFIENNFALPMDVKNNIKVSSNDSIEKYLDNCIDLIHEEQNRQVIIFDMDGVLYQLDGKNNNYHGSSLEKHVLKNAKQFIKKRERGSDVQANTMLKSGLRNPIGLSAYLARRYGISRLEYFNYVWNINPSRVIGNDKNIAKIIATLKRNPKLKFILLTSAPKIWTEKVLKHLKMFNFFESIYTAEQFGHKEEIFKMLAKRYKPKNMISVGNQFDDDIKPAKKLGMKTFLVNTPEDLKHITAKML